MSIRLAPECTRSVGRGNGVLKAVIAVMVCCGVYATLRYNVFKGVAWVEWPVYVLNKVFALSSLIILMVDTIQRRKGQNVPGLLTSGWILMLLHVGVSLAILKPAYYAKYFVTDKLTWQGGWSMMLGVMAAVGLHVYSRGCERNGGAGLLVKIGLFAFVAGVHAALLGYTGWFEPAKWPGHMIPITLLSFLTGSIALGAALGKKR